MADDDNLELKKRARRRLVGAAAIALLAIIVLPMVMDQEPQSLSRDIQILIPPQDGPNAKSSAIAMPSGPDKAKVLDEGPTAPPAPASTTPSSAPERPDPPVAREPESPNPQPAESAVAKETEAAQSKPAPVELPKQAVREADKPAEEEARAKAILEARALPQASAAPLPAGGFVVQLGAYRDVANVKSLRAKLTLEGFKTYTEPFGDKTRVRVGPYDSREAAEKASAKLKKIGLNGVVASR